jgi:type IV secretory pathway VirB4 component
MRRPVHEATTAQLGAAYPFVATPALPGGGVLIGRDLFGGAFVHDPFELYRLGAITNPNMLVLGQIGRGKSAFVKTYLYRHAAFGRRIVVLDPKGEYGPLAYALGSSPVTLAPGGSVRVNPLEVVRAGVQGVDSLALRRARLEILGAVASACVGRELRPAERCALEVALDTASASGTPTIAAVVAALIAPDPVRSQTAGITAAVARREGRDAALELRRLVSGDLQGMFDGETSPGVDLAGRVVVLDLSALYRSSALGIVLACARGALEASFRQGDGGQTILVVDEAWAVLSNLAAGRFLQSSFKLARAFGVANLAVVHRISDLAGAADAGSAGRAIAEGLLDDCETIVCYAQPPSAVAKTGETLGLGERERQLLTGLGRGVALWRVGTRSYVVEHRLAPTERGIVDTDAQLLGGGPS